jgi:uncharacterized protein (TIGR03437 family)
MTLFIIPASQNAMPVPQPAITAVASAASYDNTGVAPGEFVAIFGQSLGPQTPQFGAADSTGKLPTTLGGVQVLFNGYPAPVDYTSAGQINAIVPFEAALFSTVNVQAINEGNASAAFSLAVVSSLPGMFTAKGTGSGQAAVLNQNNTVNSASNPERVGNVLQMFATGDGARTPPEIDGRLPSTVLTKPALACAVTIGGLNATVTYCGDSAWVCRTVSGQCEDSRRRRARKQRARAGNRGNRGQPAQRDYSGSVGGGAAALP